VLADTRKIMLSEIIIMHYTYDIYDFTRINNANDEKRNISTKALKITKNSKQNWTRTRTEQNMNKCSSLFVEVKKGRRDILRLIPPLTSLVPHPNSYDIIVVPCPSLYSFSGHSYWQRLWTHYSPQPPSCLKRQVRASMSYVYRQALALVEGNCAVLQGRRS